MTKLLKCIIWIFIISCSATKQILSENQFTEEYLRIISKKYPDVNFKTEKPLLIKYTDYKGQEITHELRATYRFYEAEPNNLKQIIKKSANESARFFRKENVIHTSFIVPIIKPKDYFKRSKNSDKSQYGINRKEILWERYNSDLIIIYAQKTPFETKYKYLKRNEFESLNISRDTLLNFSVRNYDKSISRIEVSKEKEYLQLISNTKYNASLILVDEIWRKENFKIEGDIVIAIPNKDSLFITDSRNEVAVEKLKAIIQNYNTSENSISKNLYKWNGIKFERYHQ